jgi:hypothetical protein
MSMANTKDESRAPYLNELAAGELPASWADVVVLLERNPVAAAQLQAITWRRIAMELSAKLSQQEPSHGDKNT